MFQLPRQRCCYGQTTSASASATPQHSRLQATERRPSTKLRKRVFLPASIDSHCSIVGRTSDMPPSTGAHATPAGNNCVLPDTTTCSSRPSRHGWLPAGVLCWVGASLAGRCFVAGGYCVAMLVGVLLTCRKRVRRACVSQLPRHFQGGLRAL